MRYALVLTLTLALCFTAQSLALRAVGGRPAKCESNFFSSVGRIQAGTVGKPEVMFLGSSLTGRLPDRADGFPGLANMGCDGGSAIDALRAMDRGLLPVAPVIVIEVNTLSRALDPSPSEVGLSMERFWFQMGTKIPAISAYARPSGFLYSPLLAQRMGDFSASSGPLDLQVSSRPIMAEMPASITWGDSEQQLIDEVSGIVRRLNGRGTKTLFVWLPPTRRDGGPFPDWIIAMAAASGVAYWDLGGDVDPELIHLTDGAHMDAVSAARTVRTITSVLDEQQSRVIK